MSEKEELFRRIIHSMTWVVLVYYFIPDPLFGYPKNILLVLVLTFVLGFEAFRLYFGFQVYGMRDYEKRRVASYAWASIAAAVTLLFFPMYLAVLCLLGMGLVDPLIGELQSLKPELYPYVPVLTWALLSVLILTILKDLSLPILIVFSALGAVTAVAAEYPTLKVDDDFLMIVVPLFVLRGLELVLL